MNHTLIIDSLDRNWLSDDQTFDYKFGFNNNNEFLGVLNNKYRNVSSVYIEYIIVPNIFVDIKNVHCSKKLGLVPGSNGEIISSNLIFSKLSDLKYLVMDVKEFSSKLNGTNDLINNSTSIFLYDSVIPRSTISNMELNTVLDGSDIKMYTNNNLFNNGEGIFLDNKHEFCLYKNVTSKKIVVNNRHINNLNISIYNPSGEKLKLLNDSLTLKKIKSTAFTLTVKLTNNKIETSDIRPRTGLYINNSVPELNDTDTVIYRKESNIYTLNKTTSGSGGNVEINFESRKIEIECNDYFSSEEYKIGDTMVFKNIKGNLDSELISFLERKAGHTIVSLRRSNMNSTLYNIIEILPDIDINLKTGNENVNFFNLNNGNELDISGNSINKDNQHLISINIETE